MGKAILAYLTCGILTFGYVVGDLPTEKRTDPEAAVAIVLLWPALVGRELRKSMEAPHG